jgi:hypothetical protein
MSEEWGPWIEHDGAVPLIPCPRQIQVTVLPPGTVPQAFSTVYPDWPGFYWRWRRVKTGLFSSEKRRVCDDPSYAPILRYRIRKPRGLTILENLIADLPQPVREDA